MASKPDKGPPGKKCDLKQGAGDKKVAASLKIMIMNTGGGTGKNYGDKPTERRKKAIYDVVTHSKAALTLFQEFGWTSVESPKRKDIKWSDSLQYVGHNEASILFDVNEVIIEECSQTLLEQTLREMIRIGEIQSGFDPSLRMCLRKIETKGVPIIKFICVSWHGRYKAKLDDLKEDFKSILKYILKLSEKESLPVLIAGDFNIKIKDIKDCVPPTLELHPYQPTKRREEDDIIDYFISSKSLPMSDTKALSLEQETDVNGVLDLLDHDPVVSDIYDVVTHLEAALTLRV